MYGLPQDGHITYIKLIKYLAADGYVPTGHTPEIFYDITRHVTFYLIVDDFGVKDFVKEHADQLVTTIKKNYDTTTDWDGAIFFLEFTYNGTMDDAQ